MLLIGEHVEIAANGHAVFIVVEEGRNLGRSGAMSPQEFLFLIFSGPPEREM